MTLWTERLWADAGPRRVFEELHLFEAVSPEEPSLSPGQEPAPQPGELTYGCLPFEPKPDLMPVPISFEEYIAWCPEAKFEVSNGRLEIGGAEGSRYVLGLLLLSLGLVEAVRLLHPRCWVQALRGLPEADAPGLPGGLAGPSW